MPSSKPRSVTIELTPKQQEMLRKVTGQATCEVRVEFSKGRMSPKVLSAKVAPRSPEMKLLLPVVVDGDVVGSFPTG